MHGDNEMMGELEREWVVNMLAYTESTYWYERIQYYRYLCFKVVEKIPSEVKTFLRLFESLADTLGR